MTNSRSGNSRLKAASHISPIRGAISDRTRYSASDFGAKTSHRWTWLTTLSTADLSPFSSSNHLSTPGRSKRKSRKTQSRYSVNAGQKSSESAAASPTVTFACRNARGSATSPEIQPSSWGSLLRSTLSRPFHLRLHKHYSLVQLQQPTRRRSPGPAGVAILLCCGKIRPSGATLRVNS